MTFNTGNPIGSTDARDLSDNAENFDTALGTLNATWTDRLGVTRDSFEGRLAKGSFYRVGTFAEGYTLTNMRQTLEYNGHEYSWAGTFPKVVAAGATPATSGGIGAGAWVDRTDETLRGDINIVTKVFSSVAEMVADTSLSSGEIVETLGYYGGWDATIAAAKGGNSYEIVAAGTGTADGGRYIALSNGLLAKGLFKDGVVSAERFGAKGDGTTDDTLAFQKAIDSFGNSTSYNASQNGHRVTFGSGVFPITNILIPSGISLVGEGRWVSRIKAIGTSGWTIRTELFVAGARSLDTNLKGFAINGNPTMSILADAGVIRPTVGGIGLFSSIGLRVEDVSVYFLDGIGLGCYTAEDIGFTNVDITQCSKGIDLGMYDNDIANALHFFGVNLANCDDYLLNMAGGANQVRDIQFTACKFEQGYILLTESNGIVFGSCTFVSNTANDYMIKVSPGTADVRCISFVGSFFVSSLSKQAKAITATTGTIPVIVDGCTITSMASETFNGDILLTNNTFFDVKAPYAVLSARGNAYGNNDNIIDRGTVTAGESGGIVSSVHYAASVPTEQLYNYTSGTYTQPSSVVHNTVYKNITGDDIVVTARIRNLLNTGEAAGIQVSVGSTATVERAMPVLSMPSSEIRDFSTTFRLKAGWYFRITTSSPAVADVNGVLIS